MTNDIISIIEKARKLSDSEWEKRKEELLKEAEDSTLEEKINDVLQQLNITPEKRGYEFLKEAIKMCLKDFSLIRNITKGVYFPIAEKFGASWHTVENRIRYCVQVSIQKSDEETIKTLFRIPNLPVKIKFTNVNFIRGIVEFIHNS